MMALLLEPLQFTFMGHALLISLVVSIPLCAAVGLFWSQGWALMGDAMSHAVFHGIVLADSGLPLATGAFIAGVFCGGDGIPERQQPNQNKIRDGGLFFFWHVCRRS